jgi:phosphocarrier protein FPr
LRSVEIEVANDSGLHARPAAVFVKAAAGFSSRIRLENVTLSKPPVDARSLTGVLSAGVEKGHLVRIWAEGVDEDRAVEALREVISAGLEGRSEGAEAGRPAAVSPAASPATSALAGTGRLHGLAAAPGIAIGPIWRYAAAAGAAATPARPTDPEQSIREASLAAARELESLARRLCDLGRPGDAEILEAQALMAVDPALIDEAVRLAGTGLDPQAAVLASAETSAAALASLEDELLAVRAADVRDVGARVARAVSGERIGLPQVPSVAVADDVPPSLIVDLPSGQLLGIALGGGSRTAHAIILARSLEIPAVVAVAGLPDAAAEAAEIAIDGETGEIVLDPGEADRQVLADRREARLARDRRAASLRGRPCATADGERVALLANIRSADDAPRAIEVGAEGVGLFRTEFLFLRRQAPPTEAEQVEVYRRAMQAFGPERPVVVRLADIGADKPIPYLGLPAEPNPFLGVRAIRLAEAGSRELLLTQLRAVWRAAGLAGVTPHMMAAMVSTLADAELLLDLRDEARAAVVARGEPCPDRMVTGLMIEVPSAAMLAPELARLADFFSIGTNDLTQYVLAADRGNPSLARLQDALHPAVLRTIASVVSSADGAGIPVAVCGELAGDPAGALVLVGLGVDQLSADAGSLDGVRAALAGVTRAQLDELAARALAATDAETVRELAAEPLGRG